MSLTILVADDEPNIREVVSLYLRQEGFIVHEASDGNEAVQLEEEYRPHLMILDVMIPGMSGWEICQAIPRKVPVIFLTAKTAELDRIHGFSLGADDYVTKPFSPRELVARVKAVLRRSGLLFDDHDSLQFPGLVIHPALQQLIVKDQTVSLPPKEFELLVFLARHPRTVFSRQQLLDNVWGYDFAGDDRAVDATIKRVRQKIHHDRYQYIHTVWGIGYKFELAEVSANETSSSDQP